MCTVLGNNILNYLVNLLSWSNVTCLCVFKEVRINEV